MKQFVTKGIILSRTDYGEADRILTLLTPNQGKLRLMARGVRRVKSKLAGGIELFSISHITYSPGRGELGTLISTRLIDYYRHIVENIDRTMLGYELIKILNKATEDQPETEYFELLEQAFAALDDTAIDIAIVQLWFSMQLLRLAGHTPNLHTDAAGAKLESDKTYTFEYNHMAFEPTQNGSFKANHIKFLRLGFNGNTAKVLSQVQGSSELARDCAPIIETMRGLSGR